MGLPKDLFDPIFFERNQIRILIEIGIKKPEPVGQGDHRTPVHVHLNQVFKALPVGEPCIPSRPFIVDQVDLLRVALLHQDVSFPEVSLKYAAPVHPPDGFPELGYERPLPENLLWIIVSGKIFLYILLDLHGIRKTFRNQKTPFHNPEHTLLTQTDRHCRMKLVIRQNAGPGPGPLCPGFPEQNGKPVPEVSKKKLLVEEQASFPPAWGIKCQYPGVCRALNGFSPFNIPGEDLKDPFLKIGTWMGWMELQLQGRTIDGFHSFLILFRNFFHLSDKFPEIMVSTLTVFQKQKFFYIPRIGKDLKKIFSENPAFMNAPASFSLTFTET